MPHDDESLEALKQAVEQSPDNAPLRKHFADCLFSSGHFAQAEAEFSQALKLKPDDLEVKCGLAASFYQLGKYSQAQVLVESLVELPVPPPRSLILHARILLNDGDSKLAKQQYERALELKPELIDASLSERLGVQGREFGKNAADVEPLDSGMNRERVGVDLGLTEEDFTFEVEPEKPEDGFETVGGMEEVKEEIRLKIIHPLNNPEIYKAYGKKIGGGILLYGPPGCGKTHIARATAGEINAFFFSVGINDVLDMWLGSSEKNLHEIFENARDNTPSVLFFNEVDALAASRSDLRSSNGKQVINQFLSELDGVDASNEGILVLAATNAPWHLDSAFRRPGRFDRVIFVPPPDKQGRAEILRILTRGKPTRDIDFEFLARKTEKFSGADLEKIIDVAIEAKLENSLKSGVAEPLTTKDLEKALQVVKPSTVEWFATARNYALYSNQGGVYDAILKYFKK